MATQLDGAWPYQREQPDCVVLAPLPGVTPSPLPPVRIFLGTEEGQYRAERVFVWSILQVRDPARTYEVHLMNNVAGFDRRGWRTGFTCYRFAIPDFAGRTGKAIYNDVDQIYLADPALLFDLPLDGHGYLAIDARDTSVMLIDCEKMLPWWNRAAASAHGAKGPLTRKPAEVPGLWGQLDGHWNARDLEYAEGRTKCLHYTALHQQPWNPFPEDYSYHQNPLAYIWHDLERGADTAGFEVFTREDPSPGFLGMLESSQAAVSGAAPVLSPAARSLLRQTGSRSLLVTGIGKLAEVDPGEAALAVRQHDFAQARGRLPDGRFDAVFATGIFERIPGGDANWVLRELFAAAERALVLRIEVIADAWVGGEEWWRRRVEGISRQYPEVSWQLDAVRRLATGSLAVEGTQVRRLGLPAKPLVWALTGEGRAQDRQVRRVAEALGWPFEEKPLAYGPLAGLRACVLGASAGGLDPAGSATLAPPWPDVLITSGRRSAPVARWIREQSGGRARLVQLGRSGGSFALFDLVVATPDDRLPIRANVLQIAAPLIQPPQAQPGLAEPAVASLARPVIGLFLAARVRPYVLNADAVRRLARAACAEAAAHGGSLAVAADPALPAKLKDTFSAALTCPAQFLEGEDSRSALLANADRYIVTAGDGDMLAETCLSGKPVALFELPRWHDDIPVVRPVARAVLSLLGGETYRGTPLQQSVPGRFVDWLATSGLAYRPRDLGALHRSLEARGLLVRLGAETVVAAPKPLDDVQQVVARVRSLVSERTQPV